MSQNEDPHANIKARNSCFRPVVDSFWLVRWFHVHCIRPFFSSLCKPTQTSDLANVGEELYPQNCIKSFYEARNSHPEATFGSIIFRHMMLLPLLNSAFIGILTATLSMSGPLFIKEILSFIKKSEITPTDQSRAFWMAGGIVITYFLKAIFSENSLRLSMGVSVRTANIISLSIYDKLMSVSKCYGRYLTQGDYMSYLDTDQKVIVTFIRSIPSLSQSVTIVVLAQILLCLEVGAEGLCLLVIILIGLSVEFIMDKKQAKLKLGKLQFYKERVIDNIHMYSELKDIKSLGWEAIIPDRSRKIRKEENVYNKTNWLFANMYSVVGNFAPVLTVLIIELIDIVLLRKATNFVTILTAITYTNMLFTPITSIPSNIILALQARTSCFRINHFLNSINSIDKRTNSLQPGQLKINNLKATWEEEACDNHYKDISRQYIPQENTVQLVQKSNQSQTQINPLTQEENYKTLPINVPFDVSLEAGDRLVVLGDNNSGKSTFIQALLGEINQKQGSIQYGGKIGYVAQKVQLNRQSIRNNILFGEPYNQVEYHRAIKFVGLDKWIERLEKGDESVLNDIEMTVGLTEKKKIHLARALYSNCKIILMDEFFCDLDAPSITSIINNFDFQIPRRTLIICASNPDYIVKSTDKVIFFSKGIATEYGVGRKIIQKHNEQLKFKKMRSLNEKIDFNEDLFIDTKSIRLHKEVSKIEAKNWQIQILEKEKDILKFPGDRPPGVHLKYYGKFLSSASSIIIVLLFIFFTLGQASNIAAIWWIGSINSGSVVVQLSNLNNLIIYICLVVGYGLFLLGAGLIIPYISIESTEKIGDQITKLVKTCDSKWTEKQGSNFLSQVINRDNEQMFTINQFIQRIYCNFLLYIGTIILAGYQYPILFVLGAAAIAINFLLLTIYIKIERQYFYIGFDFNRQYSRKIEDCIRGVQYIRCYGKADHNRTNLCDLLYKCNSVYKINDRYIMRAMIVLSDIVSLSIVYGISAFAIGIKNKMGEISLPIIGTAITLSNKLTGIGNSILRDSAGLEIQLRSTIMLPFLSLENHQETGFDQPEPPSGWPNNSSLRIHRLTYQHSFFNKPILKELSLDCEAKSINTIIDLSGGISIECLFYLINTLRKPMRNNDGSIGTIHIGNEDIFKIGRKYVTKHVMILDSTPFILKGTIRENIDPFSQHTDEKIFHILTQLSFLEGLNGISDMSILNQVISDEKSNLSNGKKQILNLARAVLRQPEVLLCNYSLSSVEESTKSKILKTYLTLFQNTTIIIATLNLRTHLKADKVIIMENGSIIECGKPKQLMRHPTSRFRSIVMDIDPSFYADDIQ